uniref:PHD-type domain-containing protein n=1 Tax=Neolamprologus brichardi TaxID=32507 RepID=A0A3Q4GM51_NEOBR
SIIYDGRPEDGAFGGTSADLAMMSSDEDAEKCPICLNSLNSQPVATPENCEHYFCFDCILEWAKNANSCPVDRMAFNSIYLRKCYGGKVKKMITVQKPVKEGQEETVNLDLEQTNCEVCGGSDREDRLLLCDGCDAGYHMECLTPPLDSVPVEEWFCPECEANNRNSSKPLS